MGSAIGSRPSNVSAVCKSEWDKYKGEIAGKPDWDIILDDFRPIDVYTTASQFSSHFSDMIENLFLGCKEMVSREIHEQFVEIIKKRTEEITQYDWEHRKDHDSFNQVIKLYRFADDTMKERQTDMIFVMVIRMSNVSKKSKDEIVANWESCVKLQLRSHKIVPPEPVETARPRCCQQQDDDFSAALQRATLMDPTL